MSRSTYDKAGVRGSGAGLPQVRDKNAQRERQSNCRKMDGGENGCRKYATKVKNVRRVEKEKISGMKKERRMTSTWNTKKRGSARKHRKVDS